MISTRHLQVAALSIAALPILTSVADAAPPAPDLGGSLRLRFEHADSETLPQSSAISLRGSAHAEWEPTGWLTLFGEVEAVGTAGDFDDGEGAAVIQTVIPDPSLVDLNGLYVEVRPDERLTLRVGRQAIAFGEERFVGSVAFRQNHQSFDGARAILSLPRGIRLDGSAVSSVRRPLGPQGQDRALDAEAFLLRAQAPLPFGSLSLFSYDVELDDQDQPSPVAGADTTTGGATFEGRVGGEPWAILYGVTLAEQRNHRTEEVLSYGRGTLGVALADWDVDLRYERLGAGEEAFQTPLGTNHAFQGLADLFLVTPPDGIEDTSIGARRRIGDAGPFRAAALSARYHLFDASEGSLTYGREFDIKLSGRWDRFALSVEGAAYRADSFGGDVTRWWVTAETRF